MRCRAALVVLLLAELACSKERNPSPAPAGAAAGAPSASGSSASPASIPALDERAVKGLVDAWLGAQNSADFAAYERLYARRFTGIKRAGNRESTHDRKSWLADRKAMFARSMRVDVAKLELSVTPAGASAELEQTWSSDTYRDVGVKRLVVIPTPAGPRIAREEMLSSQVAGPQTRPAPGDLVVVHQDGVILSTRPDVAWASGPNRLSAARKVVTRDVDESKLPAALATWKGRAVRTFSADGRACTAKVSGFALRAEVVPHFGMEQHWRGELGQPPATAREIAEQLWDLAENGGRVLVGKLEPACNGSLWAMAEEKTPPTVATKASATPELREAAVREFRALRSYQRLQKEFVANGNSATARWDTSQPDALQVAVFQVMGKPVLVSVAAKAGTGCGDFYGALSAMFAPRSGAELELLDEPSSLEPLAAFDLDANGSFEVLFAPERASDERSLWRRDAKASRLTELFTIPYFDCPC